MEHAPDSKMSLGDLKKGGWDLILFAHRGLRELEVVMLYLLSIPWRGTIEELVAMVDANATQRTVLDTLGTLSEMYGIEVFDRREEGGGPGSSRERMFIKGKKAYRFRLAKLRPTITRTEASILNRISVKLEGWNDYVALTAPKGGETSPTVEKAGGVTKAGADPGDTIAEKLRTLKRMLDEGSITQDDYDQRKKKILDDMK
jgi:hypothetical protein